MVVYHLRVDFSPCRFKKTRETASRADSNSSIKVKERHENSNVQEKRQF